MKEKILVVDNSALVRKYMSKILQEEGYHVETAKNATEALDKIFSKQYDLVTIDIELTDKNGIEFIKEVIDKKPTRILVISAATTEDAKLTLEALDAGALDYITKPFPTGISIYQIDKEIKEKVKKVLSIPKFKILINRKKVERLKKGFQELEKIENTNYNAKEDTKYILIGASTGGPRLIETILSTLPENYPYPLCIVQHMPANFTKKFAERLNGLSKLKVVEASNGEEVVKGKAIIGKGGKHLHFKRDLLSDKITVKLVPNTSKRFFVPSVDEMFLSACEIMNPKQVVAVLLTGIGDDGADGMVSLKRKGAYTIAESEETAIVYGMPKEAYVRGGTVKVLAFPKIVEELLNIGKVV